MEKRICAYCGKEFDKHEIIYVEGKSYCQKHYSEAEMMTVEEGYDDEEDDKDEEINRSRTK